MAADVKVWTDEELMALPKDGQYSAEVSGVNGTTGVALVEVYEVP
jgi:hypothetical protein